jgi:hypothetical protein
MSREPVTLYKMDTLTTLQPGGWEFCPHGRFAWLQRLFWKALLRMRAVESVTKEEGQVIRLPLSGDGIVERIFEAYEGLFKVHRQPEEVLIGPDTLSELLNAPEVRGFDSPFQFSGAMGFGRTMFNLPVSVIPQMEGVIVR